MAPKKNALAAEWSNISIVPGELVTCADACAHELMMRLNADSNDTMIHTPLDDQRFFVKQSNVKEFLVRADQLLNPLGRKRTRPQRDEDPFENDVDEY